MTAPRGPACNPWPGRRDTVPTRRRGAAGAGASCHPPAPPSDRAGHLRSRNGVPRATRRAGGTIRRRRPGSCARGRIEAGMPAPARPDRLRPDGPTSGHAPQGSHPGIPPARAHRHPHPRRPHGPPSRPSAPLTPGSRYEPDLKTENPTKTTLGKTHSGAFVAEDAHLCGSGRCVQRSARRGAGDKGDRHRAERRTLGSGRDLLQPQPGARWREGDDRPRLRSGRPAPARPGVSAPVPGPCEAQWECAWRHRWLRRMCREREPDLRIRPGRRPRCGRPGEAAVPQAPDPAD